MVATGEDARTAVQLVYVPHGVAKSGRRVLRSSAAGTNCKRVTTVFSISAV